jgi:uncharacterized protein
MKSYHAAPMPEQGHADCLSVAAGGVEIAGSVPIARLPRLAAELANSDGELGYSVSPGVHALGKPMLRIRVEAPVILICQRCLGELRHRLVSDGEVVLVRDESELKTLDRESDGLADAVVAGPECEVMALVEDEALLSLPVAPVHPEGECRTGWIGDAGAVAPSPFAALAPFRGDKKV